MNNDKHRHEQETLLTNSAWQVIEKYIPYNTRKPKYNLRTLVEAIFYIENISGKVGQGSNK